MTIDHGRSASPSGHSRAEPEEVSALRASVPNAVFAPPPWDVRPSVDRLGNISAYDVCLPSEPDATGVGVVASVYAGEPIARLIAAAPELCEALQRTRDRLKLLALMEDARGAPESRGNAAIYRRDIVTAEEALAKAVSQGEE